MTRVNLIPVEELTRAHLVAEYRELPQIYGKTLRAQQRGETPVTIALRAPPEFRFGPGSILFFYDKILWLNRRYELLVREMLTRGYSPSYLTVPDSVHALDAHWLNDWAPSEAEIARSRERIDDRVANPLAYQRKLAAAKQAGRPQGQEWDI